MKNNEYEYEWDEAKRQTNLRKHGVDFRRMAVFDWNSARMLEDKRFDYDEVRFNMLGFINERLVHVSFTERAGAIRLISVRKANRAEESFYASY